MLGSLMVTKPRERQVIEDSIVVRWVNRVIGDGTADEAMNLMEHLRAEAMRLDRRLADPRHEWNRIGDR